MITGTLYRGTSVQTTENGGTTPSSLITIPCPPTTGTRRCGSAAKRLNTVENVPRLVSQVMNLANWRHIFRIYVFQSFSRVCWYSTHLQGLRGNDSGAVAGGGPQRAAVSRGKPSSHQRHLQLSRPPCPTFRSLHPHVKMPPRLPSTTLLVRACRTPRPRFSSVFPRPYSSATDAQPLVVVTNLPAPNSGHIRILELNRPSSRNALSRALLNSLRDQIESVHAQYDSSGNEIARAGGAAGDVPGSEAKGPTRALVIASAVDSCFCAGADLKERRGFTPEE